MKTKLGLIVSLIWLLTLTACSIWTKKQDVAIANPASAYCEDNGGTLELVFDFGETYGVCHFSDGSFCEEWEYYHGECEPKWWSDDLNENTDEIYDFESCKAAWNLVHEIYPAICYHEDKSFVQEINEKDWGILGTDNEWNTICALEAKECPDGSYVARTWLNCEFAACPGEEDVDNVKYLEKEIDEMNKVIKEHAETIDESSDEINEDSIDLMEKIIDYFKNLSSKK